jgi:membrane fusion protein (multidrug efflux system)
VSPVVDAASGTIRVTVGVDRGQRSLRPGQFVRVRLELDVHQGVIILPRKAIVWSDGEPIAWVVVDDEEEEEEEEEEAEEPGFFAKLFDSEEEEPEQADPWAEVPRRTVEKARLELGYTDARHAEILGGLEPGQPVVIVGNQRLRPDAKIRLPDDAMPKWEEPEAEEEGAEAE